MNRKHLLLNILFHINCIELIHTDYLYKALVNKKLTIFFIISNANAILNNNNNNNNTFIKRYRVID